MILIPQSVVYRGLLTGIRISSVDGTAFLDNCAALVPYADGLHRVEIYDASGRQLVGYLSAQGSGETLGAEQITGWTNSASFLLETLTVNANGHDIDAYVNDAGGAGEAYTNTFMSLGGFYKIIVDITLNSGTAPRLYTIKTAAGATYRTLLSGVSDSTLYTTAGTSDDLGLCLFALAPNACNASFLMSCMQVTAPSTDGVTIVSEKSGAVQNFALVTSGFTFNAESYTVIVRKVR